MVVPSLRCQCTMKMLIIERIEARGLRAARLAVSVTRLVARLVNQVLLIAGLY